MYCSKCGKHIGDNDRFCSGCGSKIEPSGERMMENSSYETGNTEEYVPYTLDTSEFVWDVHEFNSEHKTPEKVEVDWQKGIVTELGKDDEKAEENSGLSAVIPNSAPAFAEEEPKPSKAEAKAPSLDAIKEQIKAEEEKIREVRAAAEKLHQEEMHKKTQEPHFKFVPAAEEEYEHIHQPEKKEEDEVFERVTLEDISSDVESGKNIQNSAMKRDTARLDRFYTFNKKNEEFQKLLDREYERINSGRGEETELDNIFDLNIREEKAVYDSGEFDPVRHLKEAEAARKAILDGGIDYTGGDFKSGDSVETVKPLAETSAEGEEMRRFDTTELEKDIYESSAGLDGLFGSKTESEAQNDEQGGFENESDDGIKDQKSVYEQQLTVQKTEKEQDENGDSADNFYEDDIREKNMSLTMELDKLFSDMEEPIDPKKEKKERKRAKKAAGMLAQEQSSVDAESSGSGGEENPGGTGNSGYDDYGGEKKPIAGRILLIVVIAILILELAVLGIRYFAPDSRAAIFINDKLTDAVTFFSEIGKSEASDDGSQGVNTDADETDGDLQQDENQNQDNAAQPVSMNKIIEEQMSVYNKNIEIVTSSEELQYMPQIEYSSDKIKDTKPLTDNVFYTDDAGNAYYADREAVGTLIAFDSRWIDYVNDKDKSVFDVLKKDSNAYKNCAAFKQNVKKTFKTLKIGEIRQDDKGYYIWARETIETTSGSKTTSDNFNWVYYMEPENEKLLIVDYYKF